MTETSQFVTALEITGSSPVMTYGGGIFFFSTQNIIPAILSILPTHSTPENVFGLGDQGSGVAVAFRQADAVEKFQDFDGQVAANAGAVAEDGDVDFADVRQFACYAISSK